MPIWAGQTQSGLFEGADPVVGCVCACSGSSDVDGVSADGDNAVPLAEGDVYWHHSSPLPDTQIVTKLDAARLRRAVMKLPEKLRYVVTCRFWGDVSVREIACEESVSTVAIRKRLKIAMQHLRLALEEEGS